MAFVIEGYVDVAERIRQLREKHPEAVLRPYNPAEPFKIMEIGGREFIVYTAACFRSPDDPMPAVAVAAEPAVGKTNFTRDSEVMNAETSAWGRAIVACLAADTQKIASMEEVRNRQVEHPAAGAPKPQTREEYIAAAQAKSDAMVAAQTDRAVVGSKARPPQSQEAVVTPIKAGAMTEAQSKLMAKLIRERDVDGVAFCSEQIGRQINSTADLTKSEASKVIQALTNMKGA
jgi:hypothetical protein